MKAASTVVAAAACVAAVTARNVGRNSHIYVETTTCVLDTPLFWNDVAAEDEDIIWGWRIEVCDEVNTRVCAIRYIEYDSEGGTFPEFVLCSDELTETQNPAVAYPSAFSSARYGNPITEEQIKATTGWWAFTTDLKDDGSFERDGSPMVRNFGTSLGPWSQPLVYKNHDGNTSSGRFKIRIIGVNHEGEFTPGDAGGQQGFVQYSDTDGYDDYCLGGGSNSAPVELY
jgi:hypothetical protein